MQRDREQEEQGKAGEVERSSQTFRDNAAAGDKAKTGAVALKGRDFKISDPSQWNRIYQKAVKPYLEAGKVLSVSVGPYTKKRSVSQNSRYWALLTQISQQMPSHMDGQWFSPEVWHMHFRTRFLESVPGPDGKSYPKSTTKLSVTEFMGYCDEIEAWGIEEGIMFDVEAA